MLASLSLTRINSCKDEDFRYLSTEAPISAPILLSSVIKTFRFLILLAISIKSFVSGSSTDTSILLKSRNMLSFTTTVLTLSKSSYLSNTDCEKPHKGNKVSNTRMILFFFMTWFFNC